MKSLYDFYRGYLAALKDVYGSVDESVLIRKAIISTILANGGYNNQDTFLLSQALKVSTEEALKVLEEGMV